MFLVGFVFLDHEKRCCIRRYSTFFIYAPFLDFIRWIYAGDTVFEPFKKLIKTAFHQDGRYDTLKINQEKFWKGEWI